MLHRRSDAWFPTMVGNLGLLLPSLLLVTAPSASSLPSAEAEADAGRALRHALRLAEAERLTHNVYAHGTLTRADGTVHPVHFEETRIWIDDEFPGARLGKHSYSTWFDPLETAEVAIGEEVDGETVFRARLDQPFPNTLRPLPLPSSSTVFVRYVGGDHKPWIAAVWDDQGGRLEWTQVRFTCLDADKDGVRSEDLQDCEGPHGSLTIEPGTTP